MKIFTGTSYFSIISIALHWIMPATSVQAQLIDNQCREKSRLLLGNVTKTPKYTLELWILLVVFIVSLFNISSVDAKDKPIKKKSKYVSECISLIESSPKYLFGAMKNTCNFPINYTYCIEQPSAPVISRKDCKNELLEVEVTLKAKQTAGEEVDRGGKVYYFACRSPSQPSQMEYVQGKGIRAICTGDKDEPEASQDTSSTQTKQNKSNRQRDAEESMTVTQNKSENKNTKMSCLNEDLLEKYAQAKYKKRMKSLMVQSS